jgi:hypothetical protein
MRTLESADFSKDDCTVFKKNSYYAGKYIVMRQMKFLTVVEDSSDLIL